MQVHIRLRWVGSGPAQRIGVESQDGMVEGLMYALSEGRRARGNYHPRQENLLPHPVPMPSSSLQLSPPHHLRSWYQRTRTSSIVGSIRRFGKILGGRIKYLRRLSVFKLLDGEQDVNVLLVLCQRGVWDRANPTSTRIMTEY